MGTHKMSFSCLRTEEMARKWILPGPYPMSALDRSKGSDQNRAERMSLSKDSRRREGSTNDAITDGREG